MQGASRKLSMIGGEIKQKIIRIGKKTDEPLQFRNTFANEMRSLAQS